MPWQRMETVDLRRRFIADWRTDAWGVSALCRDYQISRTTAYKWIDRFEAGGWTALADQSRRPRHIAHVVTEPVRAAVCAARAAKPTWGARKVRRWLERRQPEVAWPSRVTIEAIWRAAGALPRADPPSRPRPVSRLTEPLGPNDVWTVDFKGDFLVGDGTRCHPLTLRDLSSRYTLRCTALTDHDRGPTQRHLERAFAEFGLPGCLRSDNGPPFAGPGLAGLSQLNVTWLRLGIRVEQMASGRPDQNGSHEHFHRVLKAATARPPAPTVRAQQRRFDRFCQEYNTERPHEALGDAVPADRYVPSRRPWPRRLPPLDYPRHWEIRRVSANGHIAWAGGPLFLSRALVGHDVALEEIDDGIWTVYFASVPLARWLARDRQLRPVR